MGTESNKQVVLEYVSAFNGGDTERLRSLFTNDAVIQGVLGWAAIEAALPIWRQLHDAFAIELTVRELIAEGNAVAVRYTERGIFRGQPPISKSYELVAMEWFEFRDGRICRRWGARDHASQAGQVGLKLE